MKERPRTARPLRPHPVTTLAVAFDWSYVTENGDELLAGLRRTLEVSAIAIAGSFVIGLVLGAARAHRVPVVSQLASIYVEIIRNTPILVQIFFLFFALPQIGIVLEPFTVAWLAVTIWGGAFNTENFRAGFEAVPFRFREAGFALGFGRLATFLNVTLPIGGRIALPSSINTYISVVKNTSLMYVISYPELTTTALNINALTLQTVETFTTLAVSYLVIVWTMSASIRVVERRQPSPRTRDDLELPPGLGWTCPQLDVRGGAADMHIAALSLIGQPLDRRHARHPPDDQVQAVARLIRLYIEVWRGLPILVMLFLVFFFLPSRPKLQFTCSSGLDRVAPRGAGDAEATRGAVQSIPKEQHEAAAALGFGWIGRHAFVILPQALRRLLPPLVSLLVNIIQNSTIAQVIGVLESCWSSLSGKVERLAAPPPIGIGEVEAIPIYATVMVIFFCISFPLTRLSAYLEKRLQ